MKKFLLILASAFALTFAFTSCSTQNKKNEFGWYENYDKVLSKAKKSNKKILLLISRDDADTNSANVKEKVFHTEEFVQKYSPNYEFCEIDVSKELFLKAAPKKDSPKEVLKDAKKYKQILEHRMRVLSIHNVTETPTLYILSPEGFVMRGISYLPVESVENFDNLFAEYKSDIEENEKLIAAVKSSKGFDKVQAIDNLFEKTNTNFRYQLTPLMREVTSIDKKDKSGLLGKYYLAIASSDALDAYLNRKPKEVSNIYKKVAKNPALSKSQKQQAFYSAAYILGTNTPTPEETVQLIELLEETISVDETSAIAERCKHLLVQVKDFQERQKALEEKIEAESAPEEE